MLTRLILKKKSLSRSLKHSYSQWRLSLEVLLRLCECLLPPAVLESLPRPLWPSLLFSASLPLSLSLSLPLSRSPSVERLTTAAPAPPVFPPSLSRPFALSFHSSRFLSSSSWSSFLLFSRSFLRSARSRARCVAWKKKMQRLM